MSRHGVLTADMSMKAYHARKWREVPSRAQVSQLTRPSAGAMNRQKDARRRLYLVYDAMGLMMAIISEARRPSKRAGIYMRRLNDKILHVKMAMTR